MQTKRCSSCTETKPVSEFYKYKRSKDNLRASCKECTLEQNRRYYENNRKKVRECTRRYRENNPEKVREWRCRRRETNRAQINRQEIKRRQETQNRSLELAHRKRLPWEDWEDEFLLADNGLTRYQKAVKLGRSFSSTENRRRVLRRKSARAELTTDTVRV